MPYDNVYLLLALTYRAPRRKALHNETVASPGECSRNNEIKLKLKTNLYSEDSEALNVGTS